MITSWSYQASQGGRQLRLKVGRAAGGHNFFIVAETAIETAAAAGSVNSFLSRISVQAGDVIGIRPVKIGVLGMPCIRMMAGYSYSAYVASDDLAPGITATFNPPVPDVQLDVAATLEVDADGDGSGMRARTSASGPPARPMGARLTPSASAG